MVETTQRQELPPTGHNRPTGSEPIRLPPRDSLMSRCFAHMLDEVDYGMLLLSPEGDILYSNHVARLELDGRHPLQVCGTVLRAIRPEDVAPLMDALAAAQRGLRRLLTVGEGEQRIGVSVVPLRDPADARHMTLVLLGKRQVCERLSVQGFARAVGLTPAETRVLEQLCCGIKPTEVAKSQQVAVSTVRTQIGSIRAKTGAGSIRELVRQVAVLPPLVGALRGSAAMLGLQAPAAWREVA